MGANLTTKMTAWKNTGATSTIQAAPATFLLNAITKDIDLMSSGYGGGGSQTAANASCFMFRATEAVDDAGGTATVYIYGANDGGPMELITILSLTVSASGTDYGVASIKWVDTITAVSTHYSDVEVIGSASSSIACVVFDNAGMRYLDIRVTTATGISVETFHRTY